MPSSLLKRRRRLRNHPPERVCYSLGEVECCMQCGPPPVNTGCCDVPQDLFATITAPGCAALHGTVIPITYAGLSGGVHRWTGSFAMGGTCGTVTFTFGIFDGPSCEFFMVLKNAGGTTLWGGEGTPDQGTIGCPFFSATNSTVNIAIPACRLSIMPPMCNGNMTIGVSP